MKQVTFIIEDKKDKNLLIALAEKLGIKKQSVMKERNLVKNEKRKELFRIIDAGVDVSNFGNPSEWHREIQKKH